MDDYYGFIVILTVFLLLIVGCGTYSEKQVETRKDIIEKTKEYAQYDYCERVDEMWYCFNEK